MIEGVGYYAREIVDEVQYRLWGLRLSIGRRAVGVTLSLLAASATVGFAYHESDTIEAALGFAEEPVVDLSVLPEELPPAVAAALPNVVKINTPILQPDGSRDHYEGSGVRTGPTEVITASHVAMTDDGRFRQGQCEDASVSSSTVEPQKVISSGPHEGEYRGVETSIASVSGWKVDDRDIARITLDPNEAQVMDPATPLKIRDLAANPLQPGDQLFIAGYGPDAEGNYRTPYDSQIFPYQKGKGYNKPHVTGAVVLNTAYQGDQLAVATGLEDYSELADPAERNVEGDSGGAFFDEHGQLVGVLSTGTLETASGYSVEEVSTAFQARLQFTGLPQGYTPSVSTAELITPDLLSQLQGLPPAPCDPLTQ